MSDLVLIAAIGAVLASEAAAPMHVEKAELTLADVADLSGLPPGLRAQAAGMVLARAPANHAEISIQKREALRRARARMPVLAGYLPSGGEGVVFLRRPASPASASDLTCWRVGTPKSPGEVVAAEDLSPAPCGPGAVAATSYDVHSGARRARRELSPGDLISMPAAATPTAIWPGRDLRVAVQVGPVRIERAVQAVQFAREGEDVFVRARDGRVFSTSGLEVLP